MNTRSLSGLSTSCLSLESAGTQPKPPDSRHRVMICSANTRVRHRIRKRKQVPLPRRLVKQVRGLVGTQIPNSCEREPTMGMPRRMEGTIVVPESHERRSQRWDGETTVGLPFSRIQAGRCDREFHQRGCTFGFPKLRTSPSCPYYRSLDKCWPRFPMVDALFGG